MPRRSKVALVDTNVVLRFLLDDDALQSPKARRLFLNAAHGKETLEIGDGVLAETVWVLQSHYRIARLEIARHIVRLLGLPGVHGQGGSRALLEALATYGSTPCDIVDCLLDARARARHTSVYTFDVTDFRRMRCAWAEPG
jgi:predicted nucleic-acid-binding protein